MNQEERERREHLGDGLYVYYTGYSYELSVNDHRNPPVAIFEPMHVAKFNQFRKRMEANRE